MNDLDSIRMQFDDSEFSALKFFATGDALGHRWKCARGRRKSDAHGHGGNDHYGKIRRELYCKNMSIIGAFRKHNSSAQRFCQLPIARGANAIEPRNADRSKC